MSAKIPAGKFITIKRLKIILGVYFLLLVFSGFVRFFEAETPFPNDKKRVQVAEVVNGLSSDRQIQIAYREFVPEQEISTYPVFLIHGSPGDGGAMQGLAKELSRNRHVFVPDLPGFGDSEISVADYSFRAHAIYVLELAEKLHIERFDVIGFSMGGGVVLNMYDIAAEKVRSVEMVSGLGVQEYELLGDYGLNHILHGVQLGIFYMMREAIPHFGMIGNAPISYARNFYDSDQRNLRTILQKIQVPFLIVHGTLDPLVPVEAAREHARLVPQSEFFELPEENHFTVFMHPAVISPIVQTFLAEVDGGTAKDRSTADPFRSNKADKPFHVNISEAKGVTAFVYFLLISLATLVSEDLAAIGAGVLAANGRISLSFAIIAAFIGIYVGDLLLFLVGRWFGTKALRRVPFRWFLDQNSVNNAAKWFESRGTLAIILSRFTPSLRLPTYFSAGMFGMNFLQFAVVSGFAVAIWAPILVVAAAWLGAETITRIFSDGQNTVWKIIPAFFAIYFFAKFIFGLSTWKGRRLFAGKLKRIVNWEFWPLQVFYIPVVIYIILLAIKHRSLAVFTCSNPAIMAGGFVGESKNEIYEMMRRSAKALPFLLPHLLLDGKEIAEDRLESARRFMMLNSLSFPVVVKPDAGERGKGIIIIQSEAELKSTLEQAETDLIIQEYFGGVEASIFYFRYPQKQNGSIYSITEKRFPKLLGNGIHDLEWLILNDPRAVCIAQKYFDQNSGLLDLVPANGEEITLIDIGTHSRGAIFLDGEWLRTETLERTIDEICLGFQGFYFGRFDIRTRSFADLQKGVNFKLIELNGVTSESTNIYDPKYNLSDAYRILFRQWRIAFEIGAENYKLGAAKTNILDLVKLTISKDGNKESGN